MRLSADSQDRGFRAYKALARNVRPCVTVDGVEVRRAITADDRLGYVLAFVEDEKGGFVANARKTAPLRMQLRGRVEISFRVEH